jgi:hypothetical protein
MRFVGSPVPRFLGSPVRSVLWATFAVALAVFGIVQDRVTAAGARRYVALQKDALAGRRTPVTIDEVMQPAIARSVRLGLISSGAVVVTGVAVAFVVRGRHFSGA